jgi:cytochrome b561
VLHWTTAALVLTMILIGIGMANADFGAWQDTLYHPHRSIGAVLVPMRMISG